MNSPFLQFTLRELHWVLSRPHLWLAFGVVVALFVLTGPFGTYDSLALPQRLGYWLLIQGLCWAIALATIAVTAAARQRTARESVSTVLIGAAIAGVPIAVAVEFANFGFFGFPVSLRNLAIQTLLNIPLSMAIGTIAFTMIRGREAMLATSQPVAEPAPHNKLLDRLPPEKRGAMLYMSMRDHYVEVVTSTGSELLLLRLGDAIGEVPEGIGLQIHRSHWVATEAITESRRESGRLVLEISDGTVLPVSRTYQAAVTQALGN